MEHHCGYKVSPDVPIAFANALEEAADNCDLELKATNSKALSVEKFDKKRLGSQFVNQ